MLAWQRVAAPVPDMSSSNAASPAANPQLQRPLRPHLDPQPARTAQHTRLGPEWLACMLVCALWFGATTGLRPLAIPDEGRYVGVAWEMLRSGNWLVPTLDGLPFFHKPPLFYWTTTAAMQLFGPGLAASRAAACLGSVGVVTGLFAFTSRWVGRRQAWTAAAVLATMPLFYAGSQYANLDMLVAGCISATILLTTHAALARAQGLPHRQALALAFVAAALGVLSKGLIGAVLPVLVLLGWGLATQRLGRVLALLMWAPGWLLFAAIAAPWFMLMQHRFPDFGHYFFVVQHLQRFTSSGFNNLKPWWFYPVALVVLTLPWSPWLAGVWRRASQTESAQADLRTLMLVWVGTVTLFFSLPASKLVGYILPAVPPLAFLVADAIGAWRTRRLAAGATPGALPGATAALAATVCVCAAVTMHFYQPKSHQALAENLLASRQAREPVVFIDHYYYDVMFYARLDEPVTVVDRWLPAEVAKDSWRRELVDATHFAPAASSRRLLHPDELDALLCRNHASWVIGPWPAATGSERFAALPPAYQSGDTALWHVAASALECNASASPAG